MFPQITDFVKILLMKNALIAMTNLLIKKNKAMD